MREVLNMAAEWVSAEHPFALATLVRVQGSSPRELGASLIADANGQLFGNVSGGCVESAVLEECERALASQLASLHSYGISDDDLFSVGLTCGGTVEVLVQPVLPRSQLARALLLAAERERDALPVALTLELAPRPGHVVVLTDASQPSPAARTQRSMRLEAEARALIDSDHAELLHLDGAGCRVGQQEADVSMLVVPFGSAPRLIVVGAVEYAVALARLGQTVGFAVTVVDARAAFASSARFAGSEVVIEWPDRYLARTHMDARTAVCVLSHDPRFDVPSLNVALASPAGYVGAMGSRRTHDDRMRRLAEAGVPISSLRRLRSPIGLDLGGRTPDETALSILAEIVAVRHGTAGGSLSQRDGAVHQPMPASDGHQLA